jgi:hypothetical protein
MMNDTSTANGIREIAALAERLAMQLEDTHAFGSEYRLQLARACAFTLCDMLHEIEGAT